MKWQSPRFGQGFWIFRAVEVLLWIALMMVLWPLKLWQMLALVIIVPIYGALGCVEEKAERDFPRKRITS